MNMSTHTNMPPLIVVAQTLNRDIGHSYLYLSGFTASREPIWGKSLRTATIYETIEDLIQHRSMVYDYWGKYGNMLPISLCGLHTSHKIAKSVSDLSEI